MTKAKLEIYDARKSQPAIAGFEDERTLIETSKDRIMDSLLESPESNTALLTLILTQ